MVEARRHDRTNHPLPLVSQGGESFSRFPGAPQPTGILYAMTISVERARRKMVAAPQRRLPLASASASKVIAL